MQLFSAGSDAKLRYRRGLRIPLHPLPEFYNHATRIRFKEAVTTPRSHKLAPRTANAEYYDRLPTFRNQGARRFRGRVGAAGDFC